MKKIFLLLACLCPVLTVFACDETCLREEAMKTHNIKFPSYLDRQYCRTTSIDFLISARNSLQKYHDERLNSAHRGGIRNIRNFLEQRKEWLQECDQYLTLTKQGRVFRTRDTSEQMFQGINRLSDELQRLVGIPTSPGEDSMALTEIARQHFQHLFSQMDSHRTDLQLRGLL